MTSSWLLLLAACFPLSLSQQHAFGRQQGEAHALRDAAWDVSSALRSHHRHKARSHAQLQGQALLRNEIALLIIPSEIRAEHRIKRLQTIARTWGAAPELRASRIRPAFGTTSVQRPPAIYGNDGTPGPGCHMPLEPRLKDLSGEDRRQVM